MIHLFDVNLLIALLDEDHVHNRSAHRWVSASAEKVKWATCPLTENAFVRITGKASYPNWLGSTSAAWSLLRKNCAQAEHHFWPDDISLCDETVWNRTELMSSAHITDCYLLALAVKQGGKLASFDRTIPAHLIRSGPEALVILPV